MTFQPLSDAELVAAVRAWRDAGFVGAPEEGSLCAPRAGSTA